MASQPARPDWPCVSPSSPWCSSPSPLTALGDISVVTDLDRDPTNPFPTQVYTDVSLQS